MNINIPLNSICVNKEGYYYLCKKLYGKKAFSNFFKWHWTFEQKSVEIIKYAVFSNQNEAEKIFKKLSENKISLESLEFININL